MIAIILGTRPEIIKMSPIIRACQATETDFFILHTGQHYSYEMDRAFFDELELPAPTYNLDTGSGRHGEQTGKILAGIEEVLLKEEPDVVLVQGDTNTVLAGALAAAKLHIKTGHVEAGLRSFDRTMPEEINRVLTDHISDYLFAPTTGAREHLRSEGIPEEKIIVTGNTVVDAVIQNRKLAERHCNVLTDMELTDKGYFLVTAHRAENVDSRERLARIFAGLTAVSQEHGLPVIFPMHPRTRKMMESFSIMPELLTDPDTPEKQINQADARRDHHPIITLCQPVGYLAFLKLQAHAACVLTDSGGLQEESCILGTPCVTLRENTERPETVEVGANMLVGTSPEQIQEAVRTMMARPRGEWENPFGDGTAGDRIVGLCERGPGEKKERL